MIEQNNLRLNKPTWKNKHMSVTMLKITERNYMKYSDPLLKMRRKETEESTRKLKIRVLHHLQKEYMSPRHIPTRSRTVKDPGFHPQGTALVIVGYTEATMTTEIVEYPHLDQDQDHVNQGHDLLGETTVHHAPTIVEIERNIEDMIDAIEMNINIEAVEEDHEAEAGSHPFKRRLLMSPK
jgi:hypothetical protein